MKTIERRIAALENKNSLPQLLPIHQMTGTELLAVMDRIDDMTTPQLLALLRDLESEN